MILSGHLDVENEPLDVWALLRVLRMRKRQSEAVVRSLLIIQAKSVKIDKRHTTWTERSASARETGVQLEEQTVRASTTAGTVWVDLGGGAR